MEGYESTIRYDRVMEQMEVIAAQVDDSRWRYGDYSAHHIAFLNAILIHNIRYYTQDAPIRCPTPHHRRHYPRHYTSTMMYYNPQSIDDELDIWNECRHCRIEVIPREAAPDLEDWRGPEWTPEMYRLRYHWRIARDWPAYCASFWFTYAI